MVEVKMDSNLKPTVILLMRKSRPSGHSIERLFNNLEPHLSQSCNVSMIEVPYFGTTPFGFIRNLIFTRRLKADVIHVTGDIYYCALAIPRNRCVLTIHDLVTIRRLAGLRRRIFTFFWYTGPLWWARYITTISEDVQQQLKAEFPKLDLNVSVIVNCVDGIFGQLPREYRPIPPKPHFLIVGTTEHKNLQRVAQAVSRVPGDLRIIGPLTQNQRDYLVSLRLNWSSAQQLSADQLVSEYRASDVLIFASTYEGFGLPILEAQLNELPVITSNIEPMASIAGDGAVLVDPFSVDDIHDGILKLRDDPILSERVIAKGRINASRYSPQTIASAYVSYYTSIASMRLD
jgi:glycosyltransferase involved in cell wall biosynthesis